MEGSGLGSGERLGRKATVKKLKEIKGAAKGMSFQDEQSIVTGQSRKMVRRAGAGKRR